MTDYPPPKAKIILSECVNKIVNNMIYFINETSSQFPDVEENKVILVNSILSGTFAKMLLECAENLDNNDKRRYIREILDNVRKVTNEHITRDILNEFNDS